MSRSLLPTHKGHTVSVWEHRLKSNFNSREKCTDPAKLVKLEETQKRYESIIAELKAKAPARLPKQVARQGKPRHAAMREQTRSSESRKVDSKSLPDVVETPYGDAVQIGEKLLIKVPSVKPRWRTWAERRRAEYLVPHRIYGYEYIGPVIID